MNKNRIVADRITASLLEKGVGQAKTPRVDFQAVTKVGNGLFKAIMSAPSDFSNRDLTVAVAEMTEGFGHVVEGSFVRRGEVAVAFIAANNVSKAMDSSFRALTKATAADESGRIWSVVNGDDGQKRVVLEAGDDLDGILKARVSTRKTFMNPASAAGISVASFGNGDFVRFVDSASRRVATGFALNIGGAKYVVSKETSFVPKPLNDLQVITAANRNQLPAIWRNAMTPGRETASLSADESARVIDYLRRAYGEASNPMLDKLQELVNKAA